MQHEYRILIAEQANGLVHIGAIDQPHARLELLQAFGATINRKHITERSPHALAVAAALRSGFATQLLERGGPWYVAEYREVMAALDQWDLTDGIRVGTKRLSLGTKVNVPEIGEGTVIGFEMSGRVSVAIDRAPRGMLTVLAHRKYLELRAS